VNVISIVIMIIVTIVIKVMVMIVILRVVIMIVILIIDDDHFLISISAIRIAKLRLSLSVVDLIPLS